MHHVVLRYISQRPPPPPPSVGGGTIFSRWAACEASPRKKQLGVRSPVYVVIAGVGDQDDRKGAGAAPADGCQCPQFSANRPRGKRLRA